MTMGAIIWWFFIFPVYAVPTIFMALCACFGLIEAPWWMLAWGASASAFGIWIRETGMPCDKSAANAGKV